MVPRDAFDVCGQRNGRVRRLRAGVCDLLRIAERGSSERRLAFRVRGLLALRQGPGPRSRAPATVLTSPGAGRPEPSSSATIRVGGPLDGVVTITAMDSPRVVVEAAWGGGDRRDRISVTRPSEREALTLADSWVNQLIDGHAPARDLRRRPRWG